MARSISNYLESNPQMKMIVIAGSQHTRKDSGIPPRVSRLKAISQASVLNLATHRITGNELEKTTDYLFFLDVEDFEPQGKIGVVLEPSKDPAVQGMEVSSVSPSSNALKSGIAEKDIIISIDDIPIREMDDIRIAMLDKLPGETVTIEVSRVNGETARELLNINVELYRPIPQRPHP
jgi:C-terminal processing protease CtpA/Prc